jgi:hypothetical protein
MEIALDGISRSQQSFLVGKLYAKTRKIGFNMRAGFYHRLAEKMAKPSRTF